MTKPYSRPEPRTEQKMTRFTKQELRIVEKRSAAAKLTISAYLREKALA